MKRIRPAAAAALLLLSFPAGAAERDQWLIDMAGCGTQPDFSTRSLRLLQEIAASR